MASKKQKEHKLQNVMHKARNKYKDIILRNQKERMEELAENIAWSAYCTEEESEDN